MDTVPAKLDQHGSVVGQDQIGRDKHEHHHYYTAPSADARCTMETLILKYNSEVESRTFIGETISELELWMMHLEPKRALAEKFIAGGRSESLPAAELLKEYFHKTLHKHQFYEAAQKIFAYMLGFVRNRFRMHIVPMLNKEHTVADVDAAIAREVVEPAVQELQANPLILQRQEIEGMVYFLMAKCWLDWGR